MVTHFQTLYRNLDQILTEKNISLISVSETASSLSAAAEKYKIPDAETAIQYMLGEQQNIRVMDFDGDVTSGKVLTSVWTLVQSQDEQEDRDNGTENLVKHL